MREPRLSPLGQTLPPALGDLFLRHANGLDPLALLADFFVTHPHGPRDIDPAAAKRTFFLVEQIVCRYFRLQVIDAEKMPAGRALIIGCHSGVIPWDAACLVVAVYRNTGRFSRNIGDFVFGRVGWIERFLKARGMVVGRTRDVERLLRRENLIVLFPGGAKDMERPIWERYQVRPHKGFAAGRGGYVKVALRTSTPIVPVAIIGAEETHMLLTHVPAVARLLGLPYFPIVFSVFPLPAKIYIRFGDPIHLDEPPEAASDQKLVDRLNLKVRKTLQDLIDDTRRHRHGICWSSYNGD